MSKTDVVAAQKSAILSGQDAALQTGLEATFDSAFSEGVASVPPFDADEQTKIDAAVAAAVAPLNEQIAKDAVDLESAHTESEAKLAEVQSALDAMTAKEQLEEAAVADVKAKIDQVQASFDAIKALFTP